MPRLSEAKKDVISCDPQIGRDPQVSEWGNPAYWRYVTWQQEQTQGTETSKYLEEEKTN
jgi:hypothetical protein